MWVKLRKISKNNRQKLILIIILGALILGLVWYLVKGNKSDSNTLAPVVTFDATTEKASAEYLNQADKANLENNNYTTQNEKYQDIFALANNYYRNGDYHGAVELLGTAITEIPGELNYMTYELLAMSYLRLGDTTQANENFEKAIELVNSTKDLPDKDLILKTIETERKS